MFLFVTVGIFWSMLIAMNTELDTDFEAVASTQCRSTNYRQLRCNY